MSTRNRPEVYNTLRLVYETLIADFDDIIVNIDGDKNGKVVVILNCPHGNFKVTVAYDGIHCTPPKYRIRVENVTPTTDDRAYDDTFWPVLKLAEYQQCDFRFSRYFYTHSASCLHFEVSCLVRFLLTRKGRANFEKTIKQISDLGSENGVAAQETIELCARLQELHPEQKCTRCHLHNDNYVVIETQCGKTLHVYETHNVLHCSPAYQKDYRYLFRYANGNDTGESESELYVETYEDLLSLVQRLTAATVHTVKKVS